MGRQILGREHSLFPVEIRWMPSRGRTAITTHHDSLKAGSSSVLRIIISIKAVATAKPPKINVMPSKSSKRKENNRKLFKSSSSVVITVRLKMI